MTVEQDTRETALAAADVQHALAGQVAKVLENQLDVIDARVDRGREVLFVLRGLVKRGADAFLQIRSQPLGLRLPPQQPV